MGTFWISRTGVILEKGDDLENGWVGDDFLYQLYHCISSKHESKVNFKLIWITCSLWTITDHLIRSHKDVWTKSSIEWFREYIYSEPNKISLETTVTKFHCLIAFTSWDIGQYVYCNCLFSRMWRHKFWN